MTARSRHSTVSAHALPPARTSAKPKARTATPALAARSRRTLPRPRREVGRILEEGESSLLDLVDNLLSKGVMLNADVILALANVDLVYIRLSALLCAADRIMAPPPLL